MAFPDLRVMIEHQGEVQGVTPTGKRITSTGIVIDRYAGGKIVEVWNIGDAVSMLQQVSAPAKAKA